MGRLYIPVIIFHLSIVANKIYCNENKITEFEIVDSKQSCTAYVILYELIDLWVLDSNREQESGSLITPMELAHPLPPINSRSRNKHWNLWVGPCVSSWWLLCPSRNSEVIYIYSYVCILIRVLVLGRIYTYTGSVAQYWWNCTPTKFKKFIGLLLLLLLFCFWSARFLCWMPLVVFFGFTNHVLLYDNKTNSMMLVTIGIRLKQHFGTRYLAFCNLSPPRMFLSLDLLSEYRIQHGTIWPFMSHLGTQGYSTG